MKEVKVESTKRIQFIDVTDKVSAVVKESKIEEGICLIYAPHTTAAITINEGADPAVVEDIINKLNKLVPANASYAHTEGNADAHIKSSLIGCSVFVPIKNNSLALGQWQSIFFCEFDGPRNRHILVQTIENKQK